MVSQDPKTIRIYHTHIEVSPYEKGENEKIEKMSSIWDETRYCHVPLSYFVHDGTLILPRGFNINILEEEFETEAFSIHECDEFDKTKQYVMTTPPRDRLQCEAIDFLTSDGKYKNNGVYSQYVLSLETGNGKTYSAVHSVIKLKMKALIITHQSKIKRQWIKTFETMTNVPHDELINIDSNNLKKILDGKLEGSYYFINHGLIRNIGKYHGYEAIHDFMKKIKVGIKVIDEAHKEFHNIFTIDSFSDTKKTFYLTATFDRTDPKESRLFKRCFSQACKFSNTSVDTTIVKPKRKHIIYAPVVYRSNPTSLQIANAVNNHGFSVIAFSKYAFDEDMNRTIVKVFFKIFDLCLENLEGKILVTAPLITQTEDLANEIKRHLNILGKSLLVGTMNSKNEQSENEYYKENADIICTTIKSSGVGTDIKGLRCVINLEPFSSKITGNQLAGRLREYAPDKDTYFFDLIDSAFPRCVDQYKKKIAKNSDLRMKCKEVNIIKL